VARRQHHRSGKTCNRPTQPKGSAQDDYPWAVAATTRAAHSAAHTNATTATRQAARRHADGGEGGSTTRGTSTTTARWRHGRQRAGSGGEVGSTQSSATGAAKAAAAAVRGQPPQCGTMPATARWQMTGGAQAVAVSILVGELESTTVRHDMQPPDGDMEGSAQAAVGEAGAPQHGTTGSVQGGGAGGGGGGGGGFFFFLGGGAFFLFLGGAGGGFFGGGVGGGGIGEAWEAPQ